MKKLPAIAPTGEQLKLISQNRLGVEVICGAAGSGKTTTALLRLRSLCYMYLARHRRVGNTQPVKVLILTFNRTLAGYVSALAESQIEAEMNIELEIMTFARWARKGLGNPPISDADITVHEDVGHLASTYVKTEVDYAMGRFMPENLEEYITAERTGRGLQPRVDRNLRRKLLDEVIYPHQKELTSQKLLDWNLLAVEMARKDEPIGYEVVVVDESQDFSANQLRAVARHLADECTVTFVIDTVQRVYARGFTWSEAGFDVRPERFHRLTTNHRNTQQIANFAAGLLNGLSIDGDGALPNLTKSQAQGPMPIVLKGIYRNQFSWVTSFIKQNVDLSTDSVAFLQPLGGRWFDFAKCTLKQSGIGFVEITRKSEWPEGVENVALSTFHSAKGLEFDYVFILGLSSETTPHQSEDSDDQLLVLRRLLAVAIARARKQVVVGYKPGEESDLVRFFAAGTFVERDI